MRLSLAYVPSPPLSWHPSQLPQSLLLAVLLHILLVLVIGNTPSGTARVGEGVWGSLNVTLRSAARDAQPGPQAGEPAPPQPRTGALGRARQERFGGAVRRETDMPAPAETPGAAQLGQWRARAAEPSEALPALESVPALREIEIPQTVRPVLAPPREPLTQPTAAAAPALAPLAFQPVEPVAAMPHLRARPRPAEPVQGLAPLAATAPAELTRLPAMEPLATGPQTPVEAPQPAALPEIAPLSREVVPAPAAVPAADPATMPTPEPSTKAAPAAPASAAPPSSPPPGRPDAGERLGHDVATPPSVPASAPRLNLQLPRGGELSSQGSRGVFQLMPRPPETKSKLGEEMQNAAKADCRKAYSELGLLAAAPLAADAIKGKGCRW